MGEVRLTLTFFFRSVQNAVVVECYRIWPIGVTLTFFNGSDRNFLKASQMYHTGCSQAVPHPSTIPARRCLTSVVWRELVEPSWYGGTFEWGEFCCYHTELQGPSTMVSRVMTLQTWEKTQKVTSERPVSRWQCDVITNKVTLCSLWGWI